MNKEYEKYIEDYKKIVLCLEELRDKSKRINELCNESLKILNNPISLMTNGAEKVEKNFAEITLNFLTINSFIGTFIEDE